MARLQRRTGRLLSVWEPTVGTTLEADAAAGATSITVDDASVFDEAGGSLYIGTQVARYSGIDDETGVVSLVDALSEAAEADDPVVRWSTLYDEVETVQMAQVAVEGDRDQGDTLSCEVSDALDLPTGDRGGDGENCTVEADGDVWTVIRVGGRPSKSRGVRFEHAEPAYTPTSDELTAGVFTRQLLHRNIAAEHGLFTQINGVTLGSEWWSLDAEAGLVTVTIPPWVADAPAERREFGWPMYAYRRGLAVTPPEVVLPEPVAVSYVGSNPVANGPTSVAFPAGVLAGDLAVAVALGRTAGNPRIDDTRFATRSYTLDGGDTIVIGTWVVDVDSPSAVDLKAPDLGGVQDGVGMVYVVRPAAPNGFLDPPTDTGVQSVGSPFEIPGFASASGSIVVLCTLGGIGGAYGWGLDGTHVVFTPSSYALIYAGFMDERPTVPSATATPGLGSYARGFQIGLGLA